MSYLFDPDLNLYLQSFGNVWLTGVMLAVSAMGSKLILVLLALLILTAIDFKKGTVILQLVLVSFVLTGLLKELFGHPRPTEVELSISEFAELLPYWIMDYVRPMIALISLQVMFYQRLSFGPVLHTSFQEKFKRPWLPSLSF